MDITLSLKQVPFQKRNFSTPWRKYHANSRKASNVCNPRQKALKKHIKPNWQTKHSKGSKNSYFSLIFYDFFFITYFFWETFESLVWYVYPFLRQRNIKSFFKGQKQILHLGNEFELQKVIHYLPFIYVIIVSSTG
jgi:hypothetical protein